VSGGVARNIAECMAKLGTRSFMISVVGNDMAGIMQFSFEEQASYTYSNLLCIMLCSLMYIYPNTSFILLKGTSF
jgi:sugar/nucleoside kinase (ribokinase family)